MSKPALDIAELSPGARLDVIEKLWDSLCNDDVPVTDSQQKELDRRLDSLDSEGPVGVSWEQVRDEMSSSAG